MDELLKSLLPSLGVFGPCAFLGWWVINTQQKTLIAKDARIEKLTDQVVTLGTSMTTAMTELKAAVKG
jgi:hypothetical protein